MDKRRKLTISGIAIVTLGIVLLLTGVPDSGIVKTNINNQTIKSEQWLLPDNASIKPINFKNTIYTTELASLNSGESYIYSLTTPGSAINFKQISDLLVLLRDNKAKLSGKVSKLKGGEIREILHNINPAKFNKAYLAITKGLGLNSANTNGKLYLNSQGKILVKTNQGKYKTVTITNKDFYREFNSQLRSNFESPLTLSVFGKSCDVTASAAPLFDQLDLYLGVKSEKGKNYFGSVRFDLKNVNRI